MLDTSVDHQRRLSPLRTDSNGMSDPLPTLASATGKPASNLLNLIRAARARPAGPDRSRIHLLDAIRAAIESVGEGLTDDELTRLLLLDAQLPTEAGFAFVSFCGGVVTLSVPQQDLTNWYPEEGWVAPEQEKITLAIAKKYGLSLCEPPDLASSFRFPSVAQSNPHQYLELNTQRETVVVAHPKYLKVRMYRATAGRAFATQARKALALDPELLQDLSALYTRKDWAIT